MPSTFTPKLNLEKPGTGEQNLTWGNTVNANFDKIDDGFNHVGWVRIGSDVNAAGLNVVSFGLPSGYVKFRMEWATLAATAATATPIARVSQDGGSTVDPTARYWFGVSVRVIGGTGTETYSVSTVSTYIPLTNGQTGNFNADGTIEFNPLTGRGTVNSLLGAATYSQIDGAFHYTQPGGNGIALILPNNTFSGGSVRLLGWKAS